MSKIHICDNKVKLLFLFISLCFTSIVSYAQTTVYGTVKDSVTLEVLPYVTVQFDGTTIGVFSDDDGKFQLTNKGNNNAVISISFIGYTTRKISVPIGKTTNLREILLEPESLLLDEIVIRPKKEKYSKKNNPAVELIKKVIEHKDKNNITYQNYYQNKESECLLIALNDFKPEQAQFKRFKFLTNYMDTSIIDDKPILPLSVRETLSEVYYRKDPQSLKRVVDAYKQEGIDKVIDTEGIDEVINEVFKDVNIYDNKINLLFHDFVGPLSEHGAVNFYKWYLSDTVEIDSNRYIELDFVPFNSYDVGFFGTLYISTDSTYVVKKALLRTPKKANLNFVDELVIEQQFDEIKKGVWVPQNQRMAIDMSLMGAVKFYVDKNRIFSDYIFGQAQDSIYNLSAPVIYQQDYETKSDIYWADQRAINDLKDYQMHSLVQDMNQVSFFKIFFKVANLVSSGYVATNKDEKKNKLDIGNLLTLYSRNSIEGNRFRLTMVTTPNFNKNIYLYGYGAYGTKDHKFKYMGEVTWSFRDVKTHKDEYPKNNLSFSHRYDLNELGKHFIQTERDNILLSFGWSDLDKATYDRDTKLFYEREYYNGFSFNLSTELSQSEPAGPLKFEKKDSNGIPFQIKSIKTTKTAFSLRYAYNEKFIQRRRNRYTMPTEKLVLTLSNTKGWDNLLGGEYNYNHTSLTLFKEFWIPPVGKISFLLGAQKIWGKVPYPLLITPNANTSFTIQKETYNLIEPLEFVNDSQVSWDVNYRMGGWLFNRIPLIKHLNFREVFGFRGFYGGLSNKNNPLHNHNLILFPVDTYTTNDGPYMEYNIGIENILKFFRIDYVHRLSYLDHPGIKKHGVRISFDMNF